MSDRKKRVLCSKEGDAKKRQKTEPSPSLPLATPPPAVAPVRPEKVKCTFCEHEISLIKWGVTHWSCSWSLTETWHYYHPLCVDKLETLLQACPECKRGYTNTECPICLDPIKCGNRHKTQCCGVDYHHSCFNASLQWKPHCCPTCGQYHGTMQLFVKTLKGTTMTVDVDENTKIIEIKEKIRDHEGIAIEPQRLIFASRYLEDEDTISYYNIQKASTLHLVLACNGS